MATYYFNTATGDDSRNSTQAQSAGTPWQTLAKFNSFFSSSSPGDNFAFQRGQTFRGTMVISRSGSSGNPINLIAYGSGADPIISAFVPLTSWTSLGANIWSHSHDAGSLRLNMVTVGGVLTGIGRYPNSGWYQMSSSGGSGSSTTLTGNMPTTINWAASGGAGLTEVVIQKTQWIVEKQIISAQSGSTITFNNANPYLAPTQSEPFGGYSMPSPATNWGYFIQNDVRACDTQNEWMHDPVSNVMKMYSTVNPNTLNVEAAGYDTVLDLSGRSYIYINGLSFRGSNIYGYYQVGGGNVTMENVEIAYVGFNGLETIGSSNIIMDSLTLRDVANCGAYMRTSSSQLINSEVYNIGQITGMGTNNNQANLGFFMVGSSNLWDKNYLHNLAYIGIYFNGNDLIIRNNIVDNYCNRFTDGGAIYGSGNETGNNSNRLIQNNIVTNGIGERSGTPYSGDSDAHGIYMDDSTTYVTIYDNFVDTVSGACIFLHNTQHVDVDKNNANHGDFAQFFMQHDTGRLDIVDCNISNNVFIARGSEPVVIISSDSDNIGTFGNFYNNIYSRLSNPTVIFTKLVNNVSTNYSLSAWKAAYGWDASSSNAPSGFVSTNPADIITLSNDTDSAVVEPLSGSFRDIDDNTYTGSVTVPARSSYILFKVGDAVGVIEIPGYRITYV